MGDATQGAGTTPESGKHARSWKNYLIERRFQLAWVARILVVVTLIVAAMGGLVFRALSESIAVTTASTMGAPMTVQAQQLIIAQAHRDRLLAGIVLGVGSTILLVAISLWVIVVTHKVAGPVYKLKRIFASVNGSRLSVFERLRKGDDLHDVFDAFEQLLARLREDRRADMAMLVSAQQALASGDADAVRRTLQQLETKYRMSVEDGR